YDSDFAIEKAKVELYTKVAVIAVNGEAKFIELQGDTRYVEEIIAPVGRVNTASQVIYLWVDDNPLPVSYDDSTVIKDSSGKELTIFDLKEDTRVRVLEDTFRPQSKVISIEVITEGELATTKETGTFVSYNKDNHMITISTSKGLVSKFLVKTPVINIPF